MRNLKLLAVALVSLLVLALAACGGDNNGDDDAAGTDNGNDDGNAKEGIELGEKDITIPYIAWAGALARTPIVTKVLEEAGYNVDATQMEAGPAWQAIADDPAAFTTAAWLPATHEDYWDEYQDDLEEIAVFVDQAPLALTVPQYVVDEYGIEEMDDLTANEEFGEDVDWTITGIDPGAGIMKNTEIALDEYGLADAGWTLQESSETAMLGELMDAYDNEEPIIVPGWKPHQKFEQMDLVMLEDPKEIYGGEGDEIVAMGNKDFKETAPAAFEIVQRFAEDYDTDVEQELLVEINVEEKEPEDVADEFLEENADLLDEWLEGIATE
ncbi:MAG TPA: glycine betaine ABC transporter substrate-binding protein [Bacillota bacterium]|nr:glycine betaine ABC transporter substrate-binding protein [Bacillota bacterium]